MVICEHIVAAFNRGSLKDNPSSKLLRHDSCEVANWRLHGESCNAVYSIFRVYIRAQTD